jgi:hypothetical protein
MEQTDEPFDVMAFVRRVREADYERTKDMTPEERVAYHRAGSAAFLRSIGRAPDGSLLSDESSAAAKPA